MLFLQLPDKVNANVNAMGLEVQKVQPASIICRIQFPGEVDELCE